MKYIKIFLFAAIVAILVIFAIKNQEKVSFVVGYETSYEKAPDITGEVEKKTAPVEEEAVETETGEVTAPVTGEEAEPVTEEVAEPVVEEVTEKTIKTIGYEKVFELPLFLILYIEAFVLIVLMSMVGIFEDLALRNRIRELTKENKKIKSEINILQEPKEEPERPKGKKVKETVKTKKVEVIPEVESKTEIVAKKDLKKKTGILDRIKKVISSGSKGSGEDMGL